MNIDWDEELRDHFTPDYVKQHQKVDHSHYRITFLEGNTIAIECSIYGYQCECHPTAFESTESLFRAHSPEYARVFNDKLREKLEELAKQCGDN